MYGRDLVKTGIAGLDPILSDGIPRGNVILLEGSIGTGKTTFGVEFVYRGASQFEEPGIIILFEVSPKKLVRDGARLGWDLAGLERKNLLKIIFTTPAVFRQELQQADSLLLEDAHKMNARRIFVDGVTAGVAAKRTEPRETFHVLAEGLQLENLTAVLALEASVLSEDHSGAFPEESIADTIIRLRMENVARATVRSIEIVKSRGHDFQMGLHSFRIVDGCGMQVYRRVQAPRRASPDGAAFDPAIRVSTGVPGLDAIVNGGYFLGSTTVVGGMSGAGKSVMALQYVAEGARRGEPSLLLSLDEEMPQIIRDAKSIGIDVQSLIDDGLLQIECSSPQEVEVNNHFDHIERLVRKRKPRRMVIDSLSTYASIFGAGTDLFRDFFHAMVALMKEHQITAVYNNEDPDMPGMWSFVDNIILLNWIEIDDVFRLGLTVAKMRANPTTHRTFECEIVEGQGMRVLPRHLPSPILPGR